MSRNELPVCHCCGKVIEDPYFLLANRNFWHEDCLRCDCCDARLSELGSICFHKTNLMLCQRDYLRLFGTTGTCHVCGGRIQAFEQVMRVDKLVYHLECFTCKICRMSFCVGDRFFLHGDSVLCETDFNFVHDPQTTVSLDTKPTVKEAKDEADRD